MARTKVMKLWTAIVTAFLALCTALGLITTSASAAVPQTATARNTESAPQTTTPATSSWSWSLTRSLPPTMKQRIHAEAHGKSPRCRHRSPSDAIAADTAAAALCEDAEASQPDPVPPVAPIQR